MNGMIDNTLKNRQKYEFWQNMLRIVFIKLFGRQFLELRVDR